jgi:hypothetical protein
MKLKHKHNAQHNHYITVTITLFLHFSFFANLVCIASAKGAMSRFAVLGTGNILFFRACTLFFECFLCVLCVLLLFVVYCVSVTWLHLVYVLIEAFRCLTIEANKREGYRPE